MNAISKRRITLCSIRRQPRRRLLTKVQDVMRKDNLPCVPKEMTLGNVIIAISDARLGIAAVVEEGKLIGVITDGDVRRAMAKYKENFFNIEAQEVMTRHAENDPADRTDRRGRGDDAQPQDTFDRRDG